MTKTITFLLIAVFNFQSFGQTSGIGKNFIINPTIKGEAEKRITHFGTNELDSLEPIYYNQLLWDVFEGDTLFQTTRDTTVKAPFKAFFKERGDSLLIFGEFGLISGFRFGFVATATDGNAIIKHFFCDEMPSFKLKLTDSLQSCIIASCPTAKLILESLPNLNQKEPLYGVVEFETEDFYKDEGQGLRKTKSRMTIYFRAIITNE